MSKRKATNWNYPTSIWFGHERTKDIVKACEHLNIKNPYFSLQIKIENIQIDKKQLFKQTATKQNRKKSVNVKGLMMVWCVIKSHEIRVREWE